MNFTKTRHTYTTYGCDKNKFKVLVDCDKKIGIIKPDETICKLSDLSIAEKKIVQPTLRFALNSENHKLVMNDENN